MTLQLVEGESYVDECGYPQGPMKKFGGVFIVKAGDSRSWNPDGSAYTNATPRLVSLWSDEPTTQEAGPVQRVMVTKIISGTYGGVFVGERDNEFLPLRVELVQRHFTADDLDGVIATLTSLSKALREMKE